jgi:hypothetical protein
MKIIATPDGDPIRLNDDGTWEPARPTGSILERWQSLQPSPETGQVFAGLFRRVTVTVIDSGESIACTHHGDHIEFASAGEGDPGDFILEVYSYQAERLADQISQGAIDDLEQFRIARSLIGARQTGSRSLKRNPLVSNARLQKIISGKNLIHVYLASPDTALEKDARFTWIHVDGEWLVVPGHYGQAQRTFRLSVRDALELQRQLSSAMNAGGLADWVKMAHWYVKWRKRVELQAKQ